MKLDKLAIAAAAVFISAGASAAWESGVGGNAGNPIDGELVLTVWNADNNRSFTQDLGVTTRQFMTGEAADQGVHDRGFLGGLGRQPIGQPGRQQCFLGFFGHGLWALGRASRTAQGCTGFALRGQSLWP